MWRDYYEKRYVALFGHLYELSRTQFGFAPLDSVRIALSAAPAAQAVPPARARAAAGCSPAALRPPPPPPPPPGPPGRRRGPQRRSSRLGLVLRRTPRCRRS